MDGRIREEKDTTLEEEGTIGAYTLGSVGIVNGGPNGIGVGSHWVVQLADERNESGSLHVNSACYHLHLVVGQLRAASPLWNGELEAAVDWHRSAGMSVRT